MDVSVFAYKNHQSAHMQKYERQVLVYPIYYLSPEKVLQ